MILLLGASGYMGQAFARELRRRGQSFIPLTRNALDYTQFELLFDYTLKMRPEFIINAAGHYGDPNVDACEDRREETLFLNTVLPQTVSRACLMTNTPWGHISSSCIYCGAKLEDTGEIRIERNLNLPAIRELLRRRSNRIQGFTENDEPNFSFRSAPCSFYSGTKALSEEAIRGVGRTYIWRAGIVFNEREESRNFLWRLQQYPKIYDNVNSLSHLGDFVRACLDLWEARAQFGIYNVTNPGAVSTREVVESIQRILKPDRQFEYWKDDEEFYRLGARVPRSNCILEVSKILSTGVRLRPVEAALENALRNWRSAARPVKPPARQLTSSTSARRSGTIRAGL